MKVHFGGAWEMARGLARASDDVQMTFRLPKALYEELKRAGNISEAARERLEAASNDEQTRRLQHAIANVASTLSVFVGPWHKDPFAWVVMRAAVDTLMTARRPKGEPVRPDIDILGEGDDPATVGRALALGELRQ
jgi:hypothetical protein